MKTHFSRKQLDQQIRNQIDRVWASLVSSYLYALHEVYAHPRDLSSVEGQYHLFKQRIVEAGAKLDVLRSLSVYLDLDTSHETDQAAIDVQLMIHRLFELEIIHEVLFYDFAAEVTSGFIAKLQEAA